MPPMMVEDMSAEELEQYKEWLEKQKPMQMDTENDSDGYYGKCGRCGHRVVVLLNSQGKADPWTPKWCPACYQRIKRWDGDE